MYIRKWVIIVVGVVVGVGALAWPSLWVYERLIAAEQAAIYLFAPVHDAQGHDLGTRAKMIDDLLQRDGKH